MEYFTQTNAEALLDMRYHHVAYRYGPQSVCAMYCVGDAHDPREHAILEQIAGVCTAMGLVSSRCSMRSVVGTLSEDLKSRTTVRGSMDRLVANFKQVPAALAASAQEPRKDKMTREVALDMLHLAMGMCEDLKKRNAELRDREQQFLRPMNEKLDYVVKAMQWTHSKIQDLETRVAPFLQLAEARVGAEQEVRGDRGSASPRERAEERDENAALMARLANLGFQCNDGDGVSDNGDDSSAQAF